MVGSMLPQVAQFFLQVRQVDPPWSKISAAVHDMHSVAEWPVQVAQEASQFAQAPVLESWYWLALQLSQLIPFDRVPFGQSATHCPPASNLGLEQDEHLFEFGPEQFWQSLWHGAQILSEGPVY
jgi:hypothetical protein